MADFQTEPKSDPSDDIGDKQKANAEQATEEILKQAKQDLPEEKQSEMGAPLKDESGAGEEDKAFLEMLVKMIEKKEIDLYVPSTLLNTPVYEKLDEQGQGKADYNALNLLSTIRQINQLWKSGDHDSYQIQNLVHQVRVTKERLEEVSGDIYII